MRGIVGFLFIQTVLSLKKKEPHSYILTCTDRYSITLQVRNGTGSRENTIYLSILCEEIDWFGWRKEHDLKISTEENQIQKPFY